MRHLVTGGAGFIGTNLIARLLQRGEEVTLLDNFSRLGSRRNAQWLKTRFPSLEIMERNVAFHTSWLNSLVERHDVVYHLAAQTAVTTSVKDPRADFEANAVGTFNVCEAVRQAETPPILIYASTNKVYGEIEDSPPINTLTDRYEYEDPEYGVPEWQRLDLHSPYGCSKGAGDQYVRDYARIYGIRSVVLRQSCIYGPYQYGHEDQGWIAWFAHRARRGEAVNVYGTGKQVRDVLYVDDLLSLYDAVVASIDSCAGEVFNVGGGCKNTLSVLELIKTLEAECDGPLHYTLGEWRPGDQRIFVSDVEKAYEFLAWRPIVSPLQGIRSLLDWMSGSERI